MQGTLEAGSRMWVSPDRDALNAPNSPDAPGELLPAAPYSCGVTHCGHTSGVFVINVLFSSLRSSEAA